MADLTGTELRLDHAYAVRSVLHRGRVTTMYAATWKPFDLPVYVRALDQIHTLALPIGNEQRIETAASESAGRVRHPAFGDIVDVGRANNHAFQVLRLPPGELLATAIQRSPLDPKRVADMLTDVASGLRACREKGLVHRGPTPDRVWLGNDGDALVLGVGEPLYREDVLMMAEAAIPEVVWHLPPESFAITPTSPEAGSGPMRRFTTTESAQLRALEDSPQAEVYALACLAYMALVGHHPFFVNLVDAPEGIRSTLDEEPAATDRLDEYPALATCIERGLSKDPADRPSTPEAFASEFRNALEGRRYHVHRTAAHPTAPDDDDLDDPLDPIVAAPSREQPAAGAGGVNSLWRLAALIAIAGLATSFVLGMLREHTLVVLSSPPGVRVSEMVGHVAVDRGRTPLLLRGRPLAAPIHLQVVDNEGSGGEPVALEPTNFDDLGRCRAVELDVQFAPTPPL